MSLKVRGIRGATTATENTKESILEATTELLIELIQSNQIQTDDIAFAYFSTTNDLTAEFPTVAARRLGWEFVALMNGHEMQVPDAQPQCIRALIVVNTEKSAQEIVNVYLRNAKNLRRRGVDLTIDNNPIST